MSAGIADANLCDFDDFLARSQPADRPVNDGDGAQCSFIGITRLIGEPEAATQDFDRPFVQYRADVTIFSRFDVGGQTGPTCLAVKEADLDGLSAGPALGPFLLSVKATPIVRSPALEEAAQANISGDERPGFMHLDQPPDRL
jgi:hypothetical protein